jgi:hypothetical protein
VKRLLPAIAVASVFTGCAHAPQPPPPDQDPLRAKDLYPLRIGNQWTYQVSGRPEPDVVEIVAEKEGFFLDTKHGRLKQDERGLRDGDRYLIEDPVRKDHSWFSVITIHATESFQISEVGHPCTVKAGTFGRCVTVRATSPLDADRSLVIESTYAEGVGLVAFHTEQQTRGKTPVIAVEAELLSYHLAP